MHLFREEGMRFRNPAKIMLTAAVGLLFSVAGVLPALAVDFSGKKITIITICLTST